MTMTREIKEQLKQIACAFFLWQYHHTDKSIELSFNEWAKQNEDGLRAIEQSIRKDQHEKSCRAQRVECQKTMDLDTKLMKEKGLILPEMIDRISMMSSALADFNDTITEA